MLENPAESNSFEKVRFLVVCCTHWFNLPASTSLRCCYTGAVRRNQHGTGEQKNSLPELLGYAFSNKHNYSLLQILTEQKAGGKESFSSLQGQMTVNFYFSKRVTLIIQEFILKKQAHFASFNIFLLLGIKFNFNRHHKCH